MTHNEKKLNEVESRVSNLETKFEMFMRSHEDFKTEMRQQNEMRAAEIREIRASLDGVSKHVDSLVTTAMAGVGTAFIAVVVLVGTLVYSVVSR